MDYKNAHKRIKNLENNKMYFVIALCTSNALLEIIYTPSRLHNQIRYY